MGLLSDVRPESLDLRSLVGQFTILRVLAGSCVAVGEVMTTQKGPFVINFGPEEPSTWVLDGLRFGLGSDLRNQCSGAQVQPAIRIPNCEGEVVW